MADDPNTDPKLEETPGTPGTPRTPGTPDDPGTPDAEPQLEDTADGADEDQPAQKVEIEELSPTSKKLKIEIPAQVIADKIADSFNDLQTEAAIPGFRRGRAPKRLLEKRFGSDIRTEVKSQVLSESFSNAVEENDLRLIGEPDFGDLKAIELPDDGPLTYEVTIEVVPPLELPELEGLKITKTIHPIDDTAVDAEVGRLGEIYGHFHTVQEPATGNDYLTVDVNVKNTEGESLSEYHSIQILCPGEKRKYKGAIAGIIVDDLGKQLEGAKAGETRTIKATGPKQHEVEAIREAELAVEVTVHRVDRMHTLSVEELTQAGGFESADDLREQLKLSLEQRAEQQQRTDMHKQVIEALLEKVDMPLPENLSAQQTQRILNRRRMEMMSQGFSEQDLEEHLAELRASSAEQAQKELKLLFILEKVAEQYEVQVTEAQINGQIATMAAQQGLRPEKMRQQLAKSGQVEQLYLQMRESKSIDILLEKAEIEEVIEKTEPTEKKTKKKTTKKAADTDKSDGKAEVGEDKPKKKTTKKKTTKKKTTKKKTTKKKTDS